MSTIKKSFTLIEILIVIVLIVLLFSLNYKVFKPINHLNINELYNFLYPNGVFYIDKNNVNNKNISIKITNPVIYKIYLNKFKEIKLKKYKFIYHVKRGIGDSFVLECKEGVFLFLPFQIKKFNSIDDVKDYLYNLKKGIF